jgi:enoyl-CoA hydratase/carnithine racemase
MSEAFTDELLAERQGSTLILTLNRPDKRNALSSILVEALLAYISAASTEGVRLLVLQGNGSNFSAGFDFGGFEVLSEADIVLRFIRIEQLLQAVYHAPFDTLALAHGKNFGAGVDLICSCSRRVANETATFKMPGLSFGIVLGTRRYASRVGHSIARRVLQEGITFEVSMGEASGFLTAQASKQEWPSVIEFSSQAATRLSVTASSRLYGVTAVDTRSQDMADLVESASLPGLKERIRAYRK